MFFYVFFSNLSLFVCVLYWLMALQRSMRAMSEPWVRQENWSEELQFNRTMGQSYMMHGGGGGGGEYGNGFGMEQYRFSPGSGGANGRMFSAATYESLTGGGGDIGGHTAGGVGGGDMTSFGEFRRTGGGGGGGGIGGLGGIGGDSGRMEHRLGYSSLDASLPHLLDQYSSIYNKNGRIGIYTREVSTGSGWAGLFVNFVCILRDLLHC
jgi:hypothetical protein